MSNKIKGNLSFIIGECMFCFPWCSIVSTSLFCYTIRELKEDAHEP